VPEMVDQELATLVRERLDARQPRRLPRRFVPPPERTHRYRWAVALVAAFLLGLSAAVLVRPEVGRRLLPIGVFGGPSAVPTAPAPTGLPRSPGAGVPTAQPGAVPSPSPEATPAPQPSVPGPGGGGTGAPGGGAPPPPSSGDVITLPLPPLPLPTPSGGVPLPVPSLPLPPLPLPTGGLLQPAPTPP
jgi:hypothetical protein